MHLDYTHVGESLCIYAKRVMLVRRDPRKTGVSLNLESLHKDRLEVAMRE